MNTLYEELYKLFFNRLMQDRKFWLKSLSEQEMQDIAIKRADIFLHEAVPIIVTTTRFDCPIDLIGVMDDNLKAFNIELKLNEKQLIADVMLERYLTTEVLSRINALGLMFNDKDLHVFAPANELKAFNESLNRLKNDNYENIKSYKLRSRDNFKYKSFDYSFNE